MMVGAVSMRRYAAGRVKLVIYWQLRVGGPFGEGVAMFHDGVLYSCGHISL